MKTQNKLTLLAIIVAAWSMNIPTVFGQPIDSVESLNNRAFAASPRAKEIFPWLTRSTAAAVMPTKPSNSKAALAEVTRNRAFAASPRVLEQFPELARKAPPLKATDSSVASTVIKNRGLASTPRAREEFPWLARGSYTATAKQFEIAPLK
jgi:hypothetical protein